MNQAIMTVQTALPAMPGGSLAAYLAAVRAFPILSAAEESELARRYRLFDDLDAARRLVLSHLRFVVRIARGYDGYGLAQSDLIQEGNVGLMKAVRRFDPDRGVRLVSFAVHWIRAEIHDFIVRNWRIVRMATTKAQRRLFFNLRSARRSLGWLRPDEAEDIARELDVEVRELKDMEARLSHRDVSLEGGTESDEAEGAALARRALADRRFDPARVYEAAAEGASQEQALAAALATLDPRSRRVVEARWLAEEDGKLTLHELAAEFGISAERVRQIEGKALARLRSALTAHEGAGPAGAAHPELPGEPHSARLLARPAG
jgi:RNA polymerase sigma-32 factor